MNARNYNAIESRKLVVEHIGTDMTEKLTIEERIRRDLEEMKTWTGLENALAASEEEVRKSLTGAGGTNSSSDIIEMLTQDPFILSRYQY